MGIPAKPNAGSGGNRRAFRDEPDTIEALRRWRLDFPRSVRLRQEGPVRSAGALRRSTNFGITTAAPCLLSARRRIAVTTSSGSSSWTNAQNWRRLQKFPCLQPRLKSADLTFVHGVRVCLRIKWQKIPGRHGNSPSHDDRCRNPRRRRKCSVFDFASQNIVDHYSFCSEWSRCGNHRLILHSVKGFVPFCPSANGVEH